LLAGLRSPVEPPQLYHPLDPVAARVLWLAQRLRVSHFVPRMPVLETQAVPAYERMLPVRKSREELAQLAGVPKEGKWIVTAGYFDRDPGLKEAVWAFDVLKYLDKNLYLICLGEGPQRGEVEALSRSLGNTDHRVRFLGPRDPLEGWYAEALFIWLSRHTGGSGLACDALRAESVIIATDQPAPRQILADAACYVPARQPVEWARATGRLLAHEGQREEFKARSQTQRRTLLPPNALAEWIVSEYDKILLGTISG
jgi:glycosyltransferase involved in cell wall biosynthesis